MNRERLDEQEVVKTSAQEHYAPGRFISKNSAESASGTNIQHSGEMFSRGVDRSVSYGRLAVSQ